MSSAPIKANVSFVDSVYDVEFLSNIHHVYLTKYRLINDNKGEKF